MWTLRQVSEWIRSGSLSTSEVFEKCMRRAAKFKDLNAFITETTEQAASAAQELDRRLKTSGSTEIGDLTGIPVAVKDNYCVKNLLTTCASRMLHNYQPPYTATVVQKLLLQDALLMGKTNMDEFAMGCGSADSIFGPVRNPWKYNFQRLADSDYDDWHISGGSSGGSAVAVATGMAYAGLGSDTGGSVRNPASYCGIVGLKPTYGLLSRHGLIPLVNSMDCPGIFTRNVEDCGTVLNILAGHDHKDSTTVQQEHKPITLPNVAQISRMHIGIPKEYHAPSLSPDTVSAWMTMADQMDNAGAKVSEVSLPHTQYSLPCYSVLCACEVASNMARYDGIQFGYRGSDSSSTEALYAETRHHGFNTVVRGRILAGNFFLLKSNYVKYFVQAMRVRQLISQDFWTVFQKQKVDLLLTPTVLGDAPVYKNFIKYDSRTRTQEQDVFTQSANMAGIPAINVPVTLSSRGLPLGLQLMGTPLGEDKLLEAAKWIEQQVSFPSLELDELLQD